MNRTTRQRIQGAGYGFEGIGYHTFAVIFAGKFLFTGTLHQCAQWADRKGIAA